MDIIWNIVPLYVTLKDEIIMKTKILSLLIALMCSFISSAQQIEFMGLPLHSKITDYCRVLKEHRFTANHRNLVNNHWGNFSSFNIKRTKFTKVVIDLIKNIEHKRLTWQYIKSLLFLFFFFFDILLKGRGETFHNFLLSKACQYEKKKDKNKI